MVCSGPYRLSIAVGILLVTISSECSWRNGNVTAFMIQSPIPSKVVVHSSSSFRLQEQETSSTSNDGSNDDKSDYEKSFAERFAKREIKRNIVDPFLPAADPMYCVRGEIGTGDFIISRHGGPTKEELSNENLLKILMCECNDLEVNTLVWKCLGYRFDPETESWDNTNVFGKWKERYPTPSDFINMQRIYSKEIDSTSLRNNQQLVKTIPPDTRQMLRKHMKPLGFTGFKVAELTPNLTRRAQCTNWLIFYREELMGYTEEELKERRRLKNEEKELEKQNRMQQGKEEEDDYVPETKEVF